MLNLVIHHLTAVEVNSIEKSTSITVMVTKSVLKLCGEDMARANDTAPLMPQMDMNNVSSRFHVTPPRRQLMENMNTFITLPINVAIMAIKPSFQYTHDD